ncbi:ATP-binding protein [Methanococcoides methylutens]|uniref:ATP-binding protein n=1 Tax=Methanococcoides methylutens TaxID=2226 RepID=UPI0040448934
MESEEYQNLMIHMDSLINGVALIDYETQEIIDVNATAANMIGRPKEQIIGHTCHKYICPGEWGNCPIRELKKTNDRSESRLLINGSKIVPILKTATVISRDGRPCIVESFIEISNIKNKEARLVKKLKIEKILSSISSLFVFSDDVDSSINKALEELSKICESSRSYIFLFNNDRTTMNNTYEYCKEGVSCQQEYIQELTVDRFPWWMSKLHSSETIHIRNVSALPYEASAEKEILEMQDIRSLVVFPMYMNNDLAGFLGFDNVVNTGERAEDINILRMATDIIGASLERKRSYDALKTSEDKYQNLVEKGNDGIIIIQDGLVRYGNQRMTDITGLSIKEEVGKTFIDFISPKYKELVQERYSKILSGEYVPSSYEIKIISKDGTEIPVDISPSAIEYEGRPADMAIIRDVTERRKTEDAMLNAKIAAEAANRTKTEFIANMSHELRTPLNSIIGFSDVLSRENYGELNENQKKYISTVLKNGKHLLNIINDILAVSSIEAMKMKLHNNDFVITDTIYEVERLMAPIASEKDIDLIFNIDIGKSTIKADVVKFKQILYNLVNNAIKFTDQGGTVMIRGKISEDFVHISVKDNGIGIPPGDQDQLFNPFYRVGPSTNRGNGGSIGLGLAVVKRFVEMQGGEVWVESEVGNGSTFIFTIPTEPLK